MNLSQNLKDLCMEKELSIVQLEEEIGIRNCMIYKYINEEYLPTLNNLVKLANYFDCSINFLVGLSDNPKQYKFSSNYNKTLFFSRYCELLKKNNISNYSLCNKLGIAKSSYRNWKNGIIPYLDTLYKIAEYFDVSIDYLVGRSDVK